MRRRIVGLDLNGRADFAARDDGEDEGTNGSGEVLVVRGGAAGSIVTSGDLDLKEKQRIIAGPQALLAPHGRGIGWGEIGRKERRRSLAIQLQRCAERDAASDVAAAVDAMARRAEEIIVAVPDLPDFAEAAQGALIAAVSARRRRARLLWRSVAAFLDLHDRGLIDHGQIGGRFRLVVHTGAGLEVQTLTLRTDADHAGHQAPQRDCPGQLLFPEIGLDALFSRARSIIQEANPGIEWERCEEPQSGHRLLIGEIGSGSTEVLRAANQTWQTAQVPVVRAEQLFSNVALPPLDGPVGRPPLGGPV